MVIICIETKVGGVEYTFAQNGVFFHVPKTPLVASGQVVSLKESIVMGEHVGSANEVKRSLNLRRVDTLRTQSFHFVSDMSTVLIGN